MAAAAATSRGGGRVLAFFSCGRVAAEAKPGSTGWSSPQEALVTDTELDALTMSG